MVSYISGGYTGGGSSGSSPRPTGGSNNNNNSNSGSRSTGGSSNNNNSNSGSRPSTTTNNRPSTTGTGGGYTGGGSSGSSSRPTGGSNNNNNSNGGSRSIGKPAGLNISDEQWAKIPDSQKETIANSYNKGVNYYTNGSNNNKPNGGSSNSGSTTTPKYKNSQSGGSTVNVNQTPTNQGYNGRTGGGSSTNVNQTPTNQGYNGRTGGGSSTNVNQTPTNQGYNGKPSGGSNGVNNTPTNQGYNGKPSGGSNGVNNTPTNQGYNGKPSGGSNGVNNTPTNQGYNGKPSGGSNGVNNTPTNQGYNGKPSGGSNGVNNTPTNQGYNGKPSGGSNGVSTTPTNQGYNGKPSGGSNGINSTITPTNQGYSGRPNGGSTGINGGGKNPGYDKGSVTPTVTPTMGGSGNTNTTPSTGTGNKYPVGVNVFVNIDKFDDISDDMMITEEVNPTFSSYTLDDSSDDRTVGSTWPKYPGGLGLTSNDDFNKGDASSRTVETTIIPGARPIANIQVIDDPSLLGKYTDHQVYGKTSTNSDVKDTLGVITTGNQTYVVVPDSEFDKSVYTPGVISQTDYENLIIHVAGEMGASNSDGLAVASVYLNRLEKGTSGGFVTNDPKKDNYNLANNGMTITGVLAEPGQAWTVKHWTYDEVALKYDNAKAIVDDALSGVRNIGPDACFYTGDGTYNHFSQTYKGDNSWN